MNRANRRRSMAAVLLVAAGLTTWAGGRRAAAGGDEPADATQKPPVAGAADKAEAVSLETARDRARLLHEVYVSTLDTVHRYYFDANRAVLPARSMEDIFAEVKSQTRVEARWIAVNTPAMSVHHEPRTEFEKQAAEAIAAGKPSYEQVEREFYVRAGAVSLGSGCVNCHTGFGRNVGEKPRFAGLVIRIPIQEGER
jgi:hypothetical protein